MRRARVARIHNRTLPIHNLSVEIFTNILSASVDPEASSPFYELACVASYWRMILTTHRRVFLEATKPKTACGQSRKQSTSPLNSWQMVEDALPSPSMKLGTPQHAKSHRTPPTRTRIQRVQRAGLPANKAQSSSPKQASPPTSVHDAAPEGMDIEVRRANVKEPQGVPCSEVSGPGTLPQITTGGLTPYYVDDGCESDPLCVGEYAGEIIQNCRGREVSIGGGACP